MYAASRQSSAGAYRRIASPRLLGPRPGSASPRNLLAIVVGGRLLASFHLQRSCINRALEQDPQRRKSGVLHAAPRQSDGVPVPYLAALWHIVGEENPKDVGEDGSHYRNGAVGVLWFDGWRFTPWVRLT